MEKLTQLAVVGYGLVGKKHVQAIIDHPESELCAIVEPIEINSLKNHYSSLDTLLENQKPDGIILATPTPLHIQQG